VVAVVTLSWDDPEPPAMVCGVNAHVACDADKPPRERATSPVNPFAGALKTV
jgi:hypothetical protein